MSGGLLINALLRETGHQVTDEEAAHLQRIHEEAFERQSAQVRPLPGARQLLDYLSAVDIPFSICTTHRIENARPRLPTVGGGTGIPLIHTGQLRHARPD